MTGFKNILLHVDRDDRNDARRTLATHLAEKFDAHLVGLFAYPGPASVYSEARFARQMLDQYRNAMAEAAIALRDTFEHEANKAGVSYEWRTAEDKGRSSLAMQGRYADLVVVGQTDPSATVADRIVNPAEDVVMTSGAPTLVVPRAGSFDEIGLRVVIAWNGSRESSRAVRDALPLLESATEVIVFSVNPDLAHLPGADIAAHLSRHGVNTTARHATVNDIEVGDAVLNAVSDTGADMLVMGAYGHSRFREFVLGGATRHVLRRMTVPTLLAH